MRYSVPVKEFVEDGKRYIKFNGSVCEIHDDIGRALYCLTYCVVRRFC